MQGKGRQRGDQGACVVLGYLIGNVIEIGDLANIEVDIDDEDQVLMLLTSFPSSYDNIVETLLYVRESLTLEDVMSSLNLRELKKRTYAKDDGYGLFVKRRSDHWGSPEERLSKKEQEDINYLFQKECAIGTDFLLNFKEFNGGTVLLGDNRAYATRGQGRNYDENYVYSLDGWAESSEDCVGIQKNESLAHVWHKCMGHISEAGLHELEKSKLLGNKGLVKLEFCKNYVLEKSTMLLSIADDYSRRVWVHFLRHKNEAFNKFKKWKRLVEN
nr:retrovirus-related Pol polyprotein from transposon TNT 1-94 [Tanacetum cinerariifolium]